MRRERNDLHRAAAGRAGTGCSRAQGDLRRAKPVAGRTLPGLPLTCIPHAPEGSKSAVIQIARLLRAHEMLLVMRERLRAMPQNWAMMARMIYWWTMGVRANEMQVWFLRGHSGRPVQGAGLGGQPAKLCIKFRY